MILKLNEAISELRKQHNSEQLIPFIGAGFSMPLNLPSWRNLIVDLGNTLGYEEDLFLLHGDYQQLAEYSKLVDDREWKKLLLQIQVGFDGPDSNLNRQKSKQHIALSKIDFKTIYTTNWDRHIEKSFSDNGKKVKTFVSIKDFVDEDKVNFDLQVMKFHGSVEDADSIIFAESDYYQRMQLENPLDQRLRSDALSNSFLFIGYSFGDPNIRFIWYKINELIKKYQLLGNNIKPRPSYIASFGTNEIQAKILEQLNINIISLDPQNKEDQICKLLKGLI